MTLIPLTERLTMNALDLINETRKHVEDASRAISLVSDDLDAVAETTPSRGRTDAARLEGIAQAATAIATVVSGSYLRDVVAALRFRETEASHDTAAALEHARRI
jgi:hypothetical protein